MSAFKLLSALQLTRFVMRARLETEPVAWLVFATILTRKLTCEVSSWACLEISENLQSLPSATAYLVHSLELDEPLHVERPSDLGTA